MNPLQPIASGHPAPTPAHATVAPAASATSSGSPGTCEPVVPTPVLMPVPPDFATSLSLLPRAFWVKCGGTLLNRVGTFVWPFLTLFMTRRGFSEHEAGWALAAAGLGSLGAAMLGGWLADTIGRRETMAFSLVGGAVSLLLLGVATSLPALLLCCFAYGLVVDAMAPANQALVADLVPREHRLAAYTADRLAINLGFAIGPVIAGFLIDRSFWALFVADAASSFAYAAIALLWLPATIHAHRRPTAGRRPGLLHEVSRNRPLVTYLIAEFLLAIAFRQFNGALVLQMVAAGCNGPQMGSIFMINGAMIVVAEIPLTHLTRRWPLRRSIAIGAVVIGAGFALNALGVSIPLVIASVAVMTIGEMLAFSRTGTYFANLSPADRRGGYAGLKSLAWGSGGIVGATFGLMLYATSPMALWISCGVLGLLSAAMLVLPAGMKPAPSPAAGA